MGTRPRLGALALVLSAMLLMLGQTGCGKESAARELRLEKAREARLERVENKVSQVSGTLSEMSGTTAQLNDQLLALQKTVEGKDEGTTAELATIEESLSALRGSTSELRGLIASLQKDLVAVRGSGSALGKRLEDLAAKLDAIDKRLWVLEARYNDHLRKFHGQ